MKAAKYALNLASSLGGELVAICVVQVPEYIEESTRASLREELFKKSRAALDDVGGLASGAGVKFSSEVVETSGAIATAICATSAKRGVDLVVLGTRTNTSTLTKMMLGSVASGVVSNSDCPVLVVR